MHEKGKSMFVSSASVYYSVFKPKRYMSYFHEFLLTYFITDQCISVLHILGGTKKAVQEVTLM